MNNKIPSFREEQTALPSESASMLDKTTLSILESLPFGVYYCDTMLTVRYINQPYADYLGVRPQDIIGRKITEFLPNSRAYEVIRSGRAELYDDISVRRDKDNRRILVNRIPIRNELGQVVGFISQLMSVGSKGWSEIWYKIEYAEKMMRMIHPATPPDQAWTKDDIQKTIIGDSPQINSSIEKCLVFGKTEEPVLITGATGVGKELFANAIHRCSRRTSGPFISINCAFITEEFIASELFGYAPGAFTGALKQGKPGQIELADKGTLFLDEIGDMPIHAQGVLLRVLETHQVQRINATKSNYVDFRLVSATNRDLRTLIRAGHFREDLFYRLNSLTLPVPSLSERHGDIPLLMRHFLSKVCAPGLDVDEAAMNLLQRYPWPGNVRELRNVLTCAAVHAALRIITPEHLPAEVVTGTCNVIDNGDGRKGHADRHRQTHPYECDDRNEREWNERCDQQISLLYNRSGMPAHSNEDLTELPNWQNEHTLASSERNAIVCALRQYQGNLTKTALLLGISRTTLYEKIKKYRITR